jgi:hypothetical protein
MKNRRVHYLFAVALLGIVLVACESNKIGDINADPGSYKGKEIQIAGEVTQSIGALGKGVYQVNDGTGSLWVYSDMRGVPSRGAHVGVKGTIVPTFTFLGINYATVMRESDRRAGK